MESTEASLQQPIINITGEKVALGPHHKDLVPLYQKWMNDFEVLRALGRPIAPITWEQEAAWYEGTTKSNDSIGFTILEKSTMRPIGTTALNSIDHMHRTSEFGILIGEKDCWNKGYGTEVARLMLDYGFTALGLHHIMLRVFSFNERGIRAYTRAGFRYAGRLRESYRFGGKAFDAILMDCLATEFQGPVLRQMLAVPEGQSAVGGAE